MLQGPVHHQAQFLGVHRLGQVVVSPLAHGVHGIFHRGVAGDDDAQAVRLVMDQKFQDFEAAHPGEGHIGEHQVKAPLLEAPQAGLAVGDRLQVVAFLLEDFLEGLPLGPVVFHHQNAGMPIHDRSIP